MADENVQVTLTAADAGASAVMQQALQIVRELDTSVKGLGASGAAAGEHAAQGFGRVKSEAEAAGAGVKTFADRTRLATMGLDAMGLEAAAAAARIGGLVDVLDEAKAALPELIALAAGITAIATSAAFLKDAITAAGKFDQSMTELGQTVRDQGGNWAALSADVLAWANLQERTTTYSRTEAVDALRKLTASGMALADAQKSVRVAEDAAAATGKSLSEVVQGLMEAEHGRTQILADLGIATRAQIKDGMTYNQVLADIEKNMGGAAQAAVNTLPGAFAQLHNAFETFEQDAGEKFQGVMIDIVHDLTNVVDAMDRDLMPELQKIADWASSELPTVEQDFKNLWDELVKGKDAVQAGLGWMIDHKDEVEAFFSVVIATKGVQSVKALTQALIELRTTLLATEGWSAASLLVESFTTKLAGGAGLLGAIKAVITGMGDLGIGAAALRTVLGGVLLVEVAALVKEFMDLGRYLAGDKTAFDSYGDVLSKVIGAIGSLISSGSRLEEKLGDWIPGVNLLAKAWERVGDAMQRAANSNLAANAAREAGPLADPAHRAATMADLERQIADPSQPAWLRANLQKQLNQILSQYNMTPAGPAAPAPPADKNPADTNTSVTGMVGGKTGAGGSPYNPPDVQAAAQDTNALAAAHTALANAISASRSAQQAETLTVDQSLTSVKAKALAEEQLYSAYLKAKEQIPQLVNDVKNESAAEHTAQQAVQAKYQAYQQSVSALNALQASLRNKTKLTADEKHAVEDAKRAVTDSKRAYEEEDAALKTITAQLREHARELGLDQKATEAYVKSQAAVIVAYNDRIAAAKQAYQDEVATAGDSIQQEIVYYEQRYAIAHAANQQFYAEHHYWNAQLSKDDADLYAKVLTLQTDAIKQHLTDVKNAQKQEEQYISTFLDDIIVQHKSFKDAFKQIWDDIVKIFIEDITKMIVESELFQKIFGNLAPGSGGTPGSGAGGDAMASAGWVGAGNGIPDLLGVPGSTATTALHVNIAGVSPGAFGAATPLLNASGTGLSMMGALGVGAAAFGVGSTLGTLESGGGPGNTHGIWGGLGSLAGVAGVSMMFGGMGGIAGLLAAGPAGWAVLAGAAVIGGLAGGAFGHKDNPAQMPDKYNTQAWGQFLADFGADNAGNTTSYGETHNQIANGQSFNINSTVATSTGGLGIGEYLHNQIAKMTQVQEQQTFGADWQQIVQMFSQWDSRGMHDGKNGNMMIGNSTYNWQQIQSLGEQAYNALQQNPSASSAPVFTLTRLYPDYNLATVKDANGNTVIGGGGSTPGTGGAPGSGGTPGSGAGGDPVGHGHFGQQPIFDFRGAQFVGPGGMQEVLQTIATGLRQLNNGELPGGYVRSQISRRRSGDWGPQ